MTLRQTQTILHTWSGLLFGWILFGIFLAGTVSFWRDEISRWTRPELTASIDRKATLEGAVRFLADKAPDAAGWNIELPNDRGAGTLVSWQPQPKPGEKPRARRGRGNEQWLDGMGRPVAVRATRGGDFFYRLHFDLYYVPVYWARCFVGLCAMFMLVAIISGVISHKKIFKDFFTFRPRKGQRSWLDGHNATAVLALPFHFMITFTGLVTLMGMYMPWGAIANYGSMPAFYAAQSTKDLPIERSARAPVPELAPLVAAAEAQWGAGSEAATVRLIAPGDVKQQIVVLRGSADRVAASDQPVRFDGAGHMTRGVQPEGAGRVSRDALIGLHAGRFADLTLRWLYFLSSIAGTVMVGSGLVLWTVKRRERLPDPARPHLGFRMVDRLNIAFVAGMPLAMTGFLWANRLLPLAMKARANAEVNVMFLTWAVAIVWAVAVPRRIAWVGLLAATALSLLCLPIIDLTMPGGGLFASFERGDSVMAAMEISFVVVGLGFGWIAQIVWQRGGAAAASTRRRRTASQPATAP